MRRSPPSTTVSRACADVNFLKKLSIEARTRPVRDLFEEEKSFKDLSGECIKADRYALTERSNKRSRTQVNTVQDDDKEAEQEEEEPAAVNCQQRREPAVEEQKC